jgi:hypothetical protein
MEQSLLEELTIVQLLKEFPTFYRILKFFIMFTILDTGHYHQPDESNPHPTTLPLYV